MNNYFTEKGGITSTSANHLANIAKECVAEEIEFLNSLSFVSSSVSLIGGNKTQLQNGEDNSERVKSSIKRISLMNAFCAYVREAIKAKDKALEKIKNLSLDEYCRLKGITLESYPDEPEDSTTEEVLEEWNLNEKVHYFITEAFAATYGKNVHPAGSVSKARKELLKRCRKPNEVEGEGRDALIYSYTPSISTEAVERLFMELQDKQRSYEKELNRQKALLKEEVADRNIRLNSDYVDKNEAISAKFTQLRQELKNYILEQSKVISNWKIIIPDALQEVYRELESLGKCE